MRGTSDTAAPRRLHARAAVLITAGVLTATTLGMVSASALAYGSTVRGGEQLLPGTTIGSVDVGHLTPSEASRRVGEVVDARLDRTVTVTAGGHARTTTPRELGASSDVDAVIAAAVARAERLDFADLVQLRWLNGSDGLTADVTVDVTPGDVERFVDDVAAEVDRTPQDAEVGWDGRQVRVTADAVAGRQLDRAAAVAVLVGTLTGTDDAATLPMAVADPDVPTRRARQVAEHVGALVDARLDHAVDVVLGDVQETVTPRQLGAVPAIDALVAGGLAGRGTDAERLEVSLPDGTVAGVIESVAAGTTVAARDAQLQLSGGDVTIVPERVGYAVDRTDAVERLEAALAGTSDRVELELRTVQPTITAASLDDVLVVDHSSTTLTLVRDGAVVRSWPVAVGTNGSPTPTGTFVVGAKRFEPTWVNPARDRWGADMPARIGPGPDNPLGARAINWNRPGGGDTLIRFHGTPHEASIGTASSNGCVRMFNADVIELYDLVESGMTIVSAA